MDQWQETNGLRWRPLAPFGAELEGDLGAPFSPSDGQRFAALFREHGLLIARNQNLSMARQQELLALLGPILIREGESGYLSNEGDHPAVKSGLAFHADAAYTEHPFIAIALHAVDVVDGASSTRFASAEKAHDNLPPNLREALANRQAEMISQGFETLARRCCDLDEPEAMVRGVRPTVVVNPSSGRPYLNISEMHTARLLDMPRDDSRHLLHQVFDHLYAADNSCEHIWRRGDLVIWDNQALQHARGSLEGVGRRVLQRVIVGTEGVAPHRVTAQRDATRLNG